ncbi:hypothetical protein FPV67DRAFT_1665002 [Lyophyllum atratum]|nr:hypothetical protein FPV67DRAFT_1665002 [Lyophyllum atratum]
MASLGQSMEAMSLRPAQITTPVPQRTRSLKDRHVFYGFPVSKEWLMQYCEKNAHRIRNFDPINSRDSVTKMLTAMKLLRVSSGIKNLTIEGVICKASEPSLTLGGDWGCLPLVCVCSSMRSSYERRPNQEQMDKLQSIVEQEPDWYVDVNPSSYYSPY